VISENRVSLPREGRGRKVSPLTSILSPRGEEKMVWGEGEREYFLAGIREKK